MARKGGSYIKKKDGSLECTHSTKQTDEIAKEAAEEAAKKSATAVPAKTVDASQDEGVKDNAGDK